MCNGSIEMTLCINPNCPRPENTSTVLFCTACGSELLLAGHYRVTKLISDKGGFGKTYEVTHNNVTKVLKVLINNHPKSIELFQQEARVLQHITHPGIPKGEQEFIYFSRNSQTPVHCFAMEKIEGLDLEEYIRNRNNYPIDQPLALEWLKQLGDILQAVHREHFFHRDIKPSNIILKPDGQLTLIDFGAARQVTATIIAGGQNTGIYTPGYAPPEQEQGYAVPQSDFYALGRTFVYLLTGKIPTDTELYDRYNNELRWRPYAPQITPTFADFIDKLMSPKASQRPQTPTDLLQELARLQNQFTQGVQPTVQTPPPTIQNISPTVASPPIAGVYPNPPVHYPPVNEPNLNINYGTPTSPPAKGVSRRNLLVTGGLIGLGIITAVSIPYAKSYLHNRPLVVGGKGKYKSISSALLEADAGQTILIKPGTYRETLTLTKSVELIGDGERSEIIIETDSNDCVIMNTTAVTPTISNLTIRNTNTKGEFFAVNISQGQLTIKDCDITSSSLSCIGIHGTSANGIITNCIIRNGKENGFIIYNNAQATVENCEIFSHIYGGLEIKTNANVTVKDCKIHSSKSTGLYVHDKGKATIENCDIYGHAYPQIAVEVEGDVTVRNCKIHDGSENAIHVTDNSQGRVEDSEIYNMGFPGLASQKGGNLVALRCKIYNNKQNGVFFLNEGQGTIEGCDITENEYSGVEITGGSQATIRNCQITNNKNYGIYAHENSNGTVEGCIIKSNGYGSFSIDSSSKVEQSNNTSD